MSYTEVLRTSSAGALGVRTAEQWGLGRVSGALIASDARVFDPLLLDLRPPSLGNPARRTPPRTLGMTARDAGVEVLLVVS